MTTLEEQQAQEKLEAAREAAAAFVSRVSRPANQLKLPNYFGLHIGAPGSGKTHAIRTMPGKVLVLDCRDGGTGTAPLVPEGDRITVIPIRTWGEMRHALIWLKAAGGNTFDSIAVDGLSRLQGYHLDWIIDNAPPRKDGKKPTQMELDMWGTAKKQFTFLVETLEGLSDDSHVMMTVWEKEASNEDTALIPALQGAIQREISGMVDIVVYHTRYTEDVEGKPANATYRCLTIPHENRMHAKCRWKTIDDEGNETSALADVEVPDVGSWIEKIHAGVRKLAAVKAPEAVVGGDEKPEEPAAAPEPELPIEKPEEPPATHAEEAEMLANSLNETVEPPEAEVTNPPPPEPVMPPVEELRAECLRWYQGRATEAKGTDEETVLATFIGGQLKELGMANFKEATAEQCAALHQAMLKYDEERSQ